MAQAPSTQLVSVGMGREASAFGTAATPSVFLIPSSDNFELSNQFLDRDGYRKRVGRTEPNTGMVIGSGQLQFEADPDTLGAALLLTMGAEAIAANAANPAAQAVTTTLSGTVSIGFGAATPAAMTNIVVGQSLTIDTAGNAETVVVKAVSTTQFWAYFTKAHANGVAITNAAVVNAYDHTFTLASPRQSFTTQINEVTAARNCVGGKVSRLSFKANPKSILEAAMQCVYQTEAKVASPTVPTYSTLSAFEFEGASNVVNIDGTPSDATVMGFSVDVDTGVVKDFPKFGNGRLSGQFPETQSKAVATIDMAFETDTMRQKFWGNVGATGPQTIVLPISLSFGFYSSEFVNTAVAYALQVITSKAKILKVGTPKRAKDFIRQAISLDLYESVNGAQDDAKFILTNASNAASI